MEAGGDWDISAITRFRLGTTFNYSTPSGGAQDTPAAFRLVDTANPDATDASISDASVSITKGINEVKDREVHLPRLPIAPIVSDQPMVPILAWGLTVALHESVFAA